MDSDTDDEMNLDEMALVHEDDSCDSLESGSEDSLQVLVPDTSSLEFTVIPDQAASNSGEAANSSGHKISTSDLASCSDHRITTSNLATGPCQGASTSAAILPQQTPFFSVDPTAGQEPSVLIKTLVCSGSSSLCPVGGSVSTNTAHGTRQSSVDEVLAFVKGAENSCTLERKDQGSCREVHVHLSKTDIHQPAAVSIGGQVHVGPPPQPSTTQTSGPTTHLKKLRQRTEKTFKEWTEGMVMTEATRTILNKITKGRTWVTVTGCPGEGKTTAGYLVLKHLHDRGREVFDVKTPDDYFKAKEVNESVIMLNDIFGALTFNPDSFKKWQDVLSDVFALSEHKQAKDESKHGNRKNPELTVVLISRLNILKEASSHMGRYKHLVLKEDNMIDLTEMIKLEKSEKELIWKCHAEQYGVSIDTRTVRDVCSLNLSHGFPHCCRLFAAMYKDNNQLDIKHFFMKPLDFLNQSVQSLIKDNVTGPLLREMLKNDGTLDLEDVKDDEKRFNYSFVAKSMIGTYFVLNDRKIEFHHPSIYDSAAFLICQMDPQFVISYCSLSFLNDRVRLKSLTQENTIERHCTVSVDSSFETRLLDRFLEEFHKHNISAVLSHESFHSIDFVSKFMEKYFSSRFGPARKQTRDLPRKLISKHLKELFHVCDIHSNRTFLFLMTKSGSEKLLTYIHNFVNLTEKELNETLFGICEHSSVSSLEYLLQNYNNISFEVKDQDNQTLLLVSTQKGSQEMIRTLLTRNANVNAMDNQGRTPLLNVCRYGVDGDGSVVQMLIEKGADSAATTNKRSPLCLAAIEGHINVVKALIYMGVSVNTADNRGDTPLQLACLKRHVDVVSVLLDKGADINRTDNDGDTPLHTACLLRNVDVVSLLLDNGADVNRTDTYGDTPLHTACLLEHVDIVSLLLDKGADINRPDKNGETPLHVASRRGHVDVVSILLDKGAYINKTEKDGETPLYIACRNEQVDVVSVLLDKGVDINRTDKDGETPLHVASRRGHVDVVSILLDKGAYINKTEKDGETPLHVACRNEQVDVVSVLLDKGADINRTDKDDETPLHVASRRGHVAVVSLLLDKGADINKTDKEGTTPLHVACRNEQVDVVSVLLDKGADVNKTDKDGKTPLHVASWWGHVAVVSLLLDKGADINRTDNDGKTPLHVAYRNEEVDVVSILLDKVEDVNRTDNDGKTPLHLAGMRLDLEFMSLFLDIVVDINRTEEDCKATLHVARRRGHVDVVSILLDKGADINKTDKEGTTPLHVACRNEQVDVVSVLLDKGADVNKTDKDGKTPLHVASWWGHVAVVSLLLDKGADINRTDNDGKTPLHVACRNEEVDVVSILLDKGADVNRTDKDIQTPLHVASWRGHVDVVSLLLDKGADINRTNKDGETPLHVASRRGHGDVLSVLLDKGAENNRTDNNGATPLHVASRTGHVAVVSLLLDKGADINRTDKDGETPLHVASRRGHVDVVSILLDKGAENNRTDNNGATPIQAACLNG